MTRSLSIEPESPFRRNRFGEEVTPTGRASRVRCQVQWNRFGQNSATEFEMFDE